jgi:DNA-binding LytR/AlgR family response regulator
MSAAAPTAVIAEDEPHLAAYLRELLAKAWPELAIVAMAKNGVEAADAIAALAPDFAFLDIKMPGLNGLEVAQGVEGTTRVVFVTAYDEFAVAAFEQQAFDYLLKPVREERLARTVERLQRACSAGADVPVGTPPAPDPNDARLAALLRQLLGRPHAAAPLRFVRASQGELVHQVPVADVLFFQAGDKYTAAHTAAGEYLLRTPLAELAAQLDPERFVQMHRSTIVNLDHLAGTRRDELSRLFVRVRGHPRELPVSRAYVHLFKAM